MLVSLSKIGGLICGFTVRNGKIDIRYNQEYNIKYPSSNFGFSIGSIHMGVLDIRGFGIEHDR